MVSCSHLWPFVRCVFGTGTIDEDFLLVDVVCNLERCGTQAEVRCFGFTYVLLSFHHPPEKALWVSFTSHSAFIARTYQFCRLWAKINKCKSVSSNRPASLKIPLFPNALDCDDREQWEFVSMLFINLHTGLKITAVHWCSAVSLRRDSCRFSESFDDNITVDDSQFHIKKNCSTFSRHSFLNLSEPLPLLYPIMLPWLRSSSSSFCAVYLFIHLSTTWLQIANHTISGAYCMIFTVCHRNYKIKIWTEKKEYRWLQSE